MCIVYCMKYQMCIVYCMYVFAAKKETPTEVPPPPPPLVAVPDGQLLRLHVVRVPKRDHHRLVDGKAEAGDALVLPKRVNDPGE